MKIDWQRAPKELGPAIADDGIAVLQDRQAVSRVLLEAGNLVDYFTGHPDPTARFEELRWHGDPVQVGWAIANGGRACADRNRVHLVLSLARRRIAELGVADREGSAA